MRKYHKIQITFFMIFLVLFLVHSCKKLGKRSGDNELSISSLSPVEELGKKLFFDANLSNPPGQPCSFCHGLEVGFTGPVEDINRKSVVYEGAFEGRFGNRKPPAASYAGDSPVLHIDEEGNFVGGMFWDGRATGDQLGDPLTEQAMGPFLNPLEMNGVDTKEVITKVKNSDYAELFEKLWGPGSLDNEVNIDGTFEKMARSIAAYERSAEVSPFSSKFDEFWNRARKKELDVADINEDNWQDFQDLGLDSAELEGFILFATKENFQKQLETSLQRLRTDYVDILYLHSCYSPEMATYEPMMEALVKAKKDGKARFIGTSTHKNEPDVIRATVDAGIYDVVLTAQSVVLDRKEDIKKSIAYAASKDIGIVAMKTHGGVGRNNEADSGIDHNSAFKWVLSDENICTTIPGMTTFEQLDFNFNVMKNYALTAGEEMAVRRASSIQNPLYCQNCRSCISSCPKEVEIPSLMRAYMYAEGYGNLLHAEMTAEVLPEDKGLKICAECSTCSASCQYGINIYDRMQSLFAKGLTRS